MVVHAASGQGKSTLAYRYLHDFAPQGWKFLVKPLADVHHARRVAMALAGHAGALGAPITVYIDVSPHDRGWADLIRDLAELQDIRVLVTVREEDWAKAAITTANFRFESIALTLNRTEASRLYSRLTGRRVPSRFISFDDAWRRFGSGGPLLEFVHLVTQNQSLRDRLSQQVHRLLGEVEAGTLPSEALRLLRIVSVVGAYEARTVTRALTDRLNLAEPSKTIARFENEFLVRLSPDKAFLVGFHPIRSRVLVELLTDPVLTPWDELACEAIPLIPDEDLETFLLFSFSRQAGARMQLVGSLEQSTRRSWTGTAAVLRSLLWLGVSDYVDRNSGLMDEAVKRWEIGWRFLLDFDLADISTEFLIKSVQDLDVLPAAFRGDASTFHERQTRKSSVFEHATRWLENHNDAPETPQGSSDWLGLAEMTFWIGHRSIKTPLAVTIEQVDVTQALIDLPLSHLADVLFARSFVLSPADDPWRTKHSEQIVRRFKEGTDTMYLEKDAQTLRAHFLIAPESLNFSPSDTSPSRSQERINPLHDRALEVLSLMRRLMPGWGSYGCCGYGHRLGEYGVPEDDSVKTAVEVRHLPPEWGIRLNSVFIGLGEYRLRPENWEEYARVIVEFRGVILDRLTDLRHALIAYFRQDQLISLFSDYIDASSWDQCQSRLASSRPLPKCAVDERGLSGESQDTAKPISEASSIVRKVRKSLALWKYEPHRKSFGEVNNGLVNYFSQAVHVLTVNSAAGRGRSELVTQRIEQLRSRGGLRTNLGPLSTYNLAQVLLRLEDFQGHFRELFYQYFEWSHLDELETRERREYLETWAIWHQFATAPRQRFREPARTAKQRLSETAFRLERRLTNRLRKLSRKGIQARRIQPQSTGREEQKTLWVAFDVKEASSVYEVLEKVLQTIVKVLGTSEIPQLGGYALHFRWRQIAIVPLVRAKSLRQTAWQIPIELVTSGQILKSEARWNFIPHAISSEQWEKLGLETWEEPFLDLVQKLLEAITNLYVTVASFCDIGRVPDLEKCDEEIVGGFVSRSSETISHSLECAIKEMATAVQILEGQAIGPMNTPALGQTKTLLSESWDAVQPNDEFDGNLRLNLQGAEQWLKRLGLARQYAASADACWVDHLLAQRDEG